jgi:hypothetical protein
MRRMQKSASGCGSATSHNGRGAGIGVRARCCPLRQAFQAMIHAGGAQTASSPAERRAAASSLAPPARPEAAAVVRGSAAVSSAASDRFDALRQLDALRRTRSNAMRCAGSRLGVESSRSTCWAQSRAGSLHRRITPKLGRRQPASAAIRRLAPNGSVCARVPEQAAQAACEMPGAMNGFCGSAIGPRRGRAHRPGWSKRRAPVARQLQQIADAVDAEIGEGCKDALVADQGVDVQAGKLALERSDVRDGLRLVGACQHQRSGRRGRGRDGSSEAECLQAGA